MMTWPSKRTYDQRSAATIAAHIPQIVSMRGAPRFDVVAPTATRHAYLTDPAWSAQPTEYAFPLAIR
jgi:hypothetical protein